MSRTWLHVSEGLARAGFSDASEFDRWVADPDREEFEANYEQLIEEVPPRNSAEPRACVDPTVIVAAAACELGISLEQLTSRRRTTKELLARQIVVHCSESLGLRGVDIARALGITQQAVSLIRSRGITLDARMIGTRVVDRIVVARCAW